MIAEIHGKVSSMNTNLTERLEDELTGNFFGNLRYISFNEGLKKILVQSIFPRELSLDFNRINEVEWNDKIHFWRRDKKEGEIDVCIEFSNIVIGIEVKLHSSLSYDLNINENIPGIESNSTDEKLSKDQLDREARMLHHWASGKEKILLLLADEEYCSKAYKQTIEKGFEKGVKLGYISWQRMLQGLKSLNLNNPFDKIVVNDLIDLLRHKGLEQFQNFYEETNINRDIYWTFSAKATRKFNFVTTKKVNGGLYYEFRK